VQFFISFIRLDDKKETFIKALSYFIQQAVSFEVQPGFQVSAL
jgi:hypothetical protein